MKRGREILPNAKDCAQTLYKRAFELGPSIRGHNRRDAVLRKDALVKESSCMLWREVVSRQEVHHPGQLIRNRKDVTVFSVI
jgi:hypothetical protein